MKEILLITPPFTQLNTPYPATAYLKGFLNKKGINAFQVDLGIEVINKLFTKECLSELFTLAGNKNSIKSENAQRIYSLKENYLQTIDSVILFLQGRNQTLARQICSELYLPQASRFELLDDLEFAFGNMGIQDKAKHLSTLYLEDLSDFIIECIDENFGFSRYAEKLGMSANSFNEIYTQLLSKPSYIENLSLELLFEKIERFSPKLICFSVPFPGNLLIAFRSAQFIKRQFPNIKIAMGGGFPNTELRSLKDKRVFEFFDYICLDDGELPIELLYANLDKFKSKFLEYKRTFLIENDLLVFNDKSTKTDYKQSEIGTPDYSDLLLDKYISVIEIANPMHSLWSDGRWNKLTMAHGCYWAKCTFCDISLDYIRLYEPITAKLLVDRVEQIIAQTGETGFHFVDEAAPPTLMRALAIELIKRKVKITWWANIRFEKSFTADLCKLFQASGCIAVSGGLEVASDRLLKLINKGITVQQVAQVTNNFTEAGIMVHAYLMYGYPSQTVQETIDSLEMVRQLFENGVIHSGFWHQFALTAHSPIGLEPDKYGINPKLEKIEFANNDISFTDNTSIDHNKFSFGLKKSLLNYMHNIGFELELDTWFSQESDFKIPKTTISPDFIFDSISQSKSSYPKASSKIVWLGNYPIIHEFQKKKKGKHVNYTQLIFHENTLAFEIELEKEKAEWFLVQIDQLMINDKTLTTFSELKNSYEKLFGDFELFWYSKAMQTLKKNKLLVF